MSCMFCDENEFALMGLQYKGTLKQQVSIASQLYELNCSSYERTYTGEKISAAEKAIDLSKIKCEVSRLSGQEIDPIMVFGIARKIDYNCDTSMDFTEQHHSWLLRVAITAFNQKVNQGDVREWTGSVDQIKEVLDLYSTKSDSSNITFESPDGTQYLNSCHMSRIPNSMKPRETLKLLPGLMDAAKNGYSLGATETVESPRIGNHPGRSSASELTAVDIIESITVHLPIKMGYETPWKFEEDSSPDPF